MGEIWKGLLSGTGVFLVFCALLKFWGDIRGQQSTQQTKYYGDLGERIAALEEDGRKQLDKIMELGREVAELVGENKVLAGEVAERDRTIAERDKTIEEKNATIARLREQRDTYRRSAMRTKAHAEQIGLDELSTPLGAELSDADEANSTVETR